MQEVLTWPGQWVAGHLGEPGLPLPSSTHGVFSSSSSGPQGFKGAVGQFNNNGVIGVVDENGNIRTINSPFATAPASARECPSAKFCKRDCLNDASHHRTLSACIMPK